MIGRGAAFRTACGLAGAALLAVATGCRGDRTPDDRLIDHLEAAGIVASPLAEVEALFSPLTRDVRSEAFAPVDLDGRRVWAVPTPFPAAAENIDVAADDFEIRRAGARLKRSDEAGPGEWSWTWIKGEAALLFSPAGRPETRAETVSLGPGESAEVALLTPPGPALFEIAAEPGSFGAAARLEVSIDGGPGRKLLLGPGGVVRFIETMPLGRSFLRVTAPPAEGPRGTAASALRLAPSKVISGRDLLLIQPPPGVPRFDGEFRIRFVPGPRDAIVPVHRRLDAGSGLSLDLPVAEPEGFRLELLCRSEEGGERLTLRMDGGPASTFDVARGGGVFSFPGRSGGGTVRLEATASLPDGRPGPGGAVLDGIVVRDARRTAALPLYRFRFFRSLDEGLGGNPYFIKAKFKVNRETHQAIFAPPESEYRFRVRVPADGALDIGYGLAAEARDAENSGAGFEILLDEGGEAKSLFRTSLDPYHEEKDRGVFRRKISLKEYAGRKVGIRLATRAAGSPPGRPAPGSAVIPAFWADPVLVSRAAPGDGPPNIVLISIDTLRADHLGCYGYGRPTSPAIDRLAADSALFLDVMSASPYTISTHMSLLTGLDPTHHQVVYHSRSLDSGITTLPEILRRSGYACAAFTGGGALSSRFGFAEGFDYYGETAGANEHEDSADRLFRRASSWLRRNGERRFFLFLHTYQPHNPYISPAPWGQAFLRPEHPWRSIRLQDVIGAGSPNLFRRLPPPERENIVALYDGEIRYTDEAFLGPFIEELKALGLYHDTLIVFTSDHGEEFYEHGSWEHVHTLYEELLHVPLIVKFPGGRHKGLRVGGLAGTVDVMPTILEAAGLGRRNREIDGSSLSDLLAGREKRGRSRLAYLPAEFADHMPRRVAVREGPFKLILNDPFPPAAYDYFVPPPPQTIPVELYRIDRDPLEARNLASAEPNLVKRLSGAIHDALKTGEGKRARVILLDRDVEERLRALGYLH